MKRVTATLAALLVLGPVLYVLSIGPAYALIRRDLVSQRLADVYRPVLVVGESWDAGGDLLIWYLNMWYSEREEPS